MHDTIVRLADVWKTCNKIRAAAFRVGLNLWDWYRPLDPEGNSLISESKFVSILAGPLRSVIGLSDSEIAQLADYFRAQDGRVLYHQLCQIIHGEDAGGRDKTSADCILEACPPPPEPECHKLDQWQIRRLCCLLATIAERDLPLKPYFQDYELVAKNDGRITFAHFARILNYIGVIVTAEDFNLLVRKFIKDSYTIDYVDFLKAVDDVKKQGIRGLGPAYLNPSAVIDTTLPKLARPEVEAGMSTAPLGFQETFHPALTQPHPPRQLVDLMLRVQEFVLQRRIRVSEFLRDYDPLNSGRIAPQQFRRGLDAMGLGSILSQNELLCVMRHYLDPNDSERVCWRTFEDDCDQVFTIKELEKHPEARAGAAAAAVLELPARGSAPDRAEGESPADLDAAQAALLRVRAACTERAIDLRPAFCDHDEQLNHLKITMITDPNELNVDTTTGTCRARRCGACWRGWACCRRRSRCARSRRGTSTTAASTTCACSTRWWSGRWRAPASRAPRPPRTARAPPARTRCRQTSCRYSPRSRARWCARECGRASSSSSSTRATSW